MTAVTSVSLDISDVEWDQWMDIFLEFKPIVMRQLYLRLDGVATTGRYKDYNSNSQTQLGIYGTTASAEYDVTPFRIALKAGRIQDTEYFWATACYWEPWVYTYTGTVNMDGTSSLRDHAYKTYGKWCKMQTLDFTPTSGNSSTYIVSWSNIRLIGIKAP